MVQIGNEPRTEIFFDGYKTKEQLISAIVHMPKIGGARNLGKALKVVKQFVVENKLGARKDSSKVSSH